MTFQMLYIADHGVIFVHFIQFKLFYFNDF